MTGVTGVRGGPPVLWDLLVVLGVGKGRGLVALRRGHEDVVREEVPVGAGEVGQDGVEGLGVVAVREVRVELAEPVDVEDVVALAVDGVGDEGGSAAVVPGPEAGVGVRREGKGGQGKVRERGMEVPVFDGGVWHIREVEDEGDEARYDDHVVVDCVVGEDAPGGDGVGPELVDGKGDGAGGRQGHAEV